MIRRSRLHPLVLLSIVGLLLTLLFALTLVSSSIPGLVRLNKRPNRSPIFRALPSKLDEPQHSDSCIQDLHSIRFSQARGTDGQHERLQSRHEDASVEDTSEATLSWSWDKDSKCTRQRFTHEEALKALKCRKIQFVGDSIIRFLAQAVLRLLVSDEHPMPDFPRHQSVEYVTPCVTVQFLWRPFAANVSSELASWAHNPNDVGDIVIAGAALWDVLHVRSIQQYSAAMHATREALQALLVQGSSNPKAVMWTSTSIVHHSNLQTDEKRATMTEGNVASYRRAQTELLLERAAHLEQFDVLDMHRITRQAPSWSSADGIHYVEAVYDASATVLFNMLRTHSAIVTANDCTPCPV